MFDLSRSHNRSPASRLAAFLIPAAIMAGAFFWINEVQNGSFFTASYQRGLSYARENGFRFSAWPEDPGIAVTNLRFSDPIARIKTSIFALFRLNFALFGWPASVLFLPLAGMRRESGLLWSALAWFFASHLLLADVGIDSFGPVHYFETSWPILLLTALGLQRATRRWACSVQNDSQVAPPRGIYPPALLVALVLTALAGYVPVRLAALARIADNVNLPRDVVRAAGLRRAVIFAPRPFAPPCISRPTEHFVFWRPNNDPDLKNGILWVNHISVEEDRRLMEQFPDRRGYVLRWKRGCRIEVLPLEQLSPGSIPDGYMGGTGRVH